METKHTPGPWHIGMAPGPIIYGEKGEQIASLFPRMVPQDENSANARLIVAVPDMLDAAEFAADVWDEVAQWRDLSEEEIEAREGLRAAIAKATGGE